MGRWTKIISFGEEGNEADEIRLAHEVFKAIEKTNANVVVNIFINARSSGGGATTRVEVK